MKKTYLQPKLRVAVIETSSILAGSQVEISAGGPTSDAPYAKSSYGFVDDEWGKVAKKPWE